MDGAKEVVDAINGLRDDIDQRHVENVTAQAVTDAKVVEAIRGIDELRRAFPGGDWDGHRRYHEAVIKRIEAREKFYQDLRTDLATKGLWAVIIALGGAVLFYIRAKVTS
ncbi:hypothetical protein [Paraburkholderia domus]|uniref:hypothetical protein n=1 Tax=Paraburkholderia domus TaxID=2793075 RepID=UPI00191183D4|nr:hypothetical protein [Paraburkholderia domus]MBK5061812.1 hypothetical protein [Burkholderia sp. R-70199]CAE6901015.1 hypothetical protein R70199_03693 [Paraburkholderia domus]